jgi:hypothetical protein
MIRNAISGLAALFYIFCSVELLLSTAKIKNKLWKRFECSH